MVGIIYGHLVVQLLMLQVNVMAAVIIMLNIYGDKNERMEFRVESDTDPNV